MSLQVEHTGAVTHLLFHPHSTVSDGQSVPCIWGNLWVYRSRMGALQSFLDSPADVDGDDIDPAEPVRRVRAILSQLRLPAELVLEIMDLAEYYPCVRAARTSLVRMRADAHTRRDYCSSLLYLMSPPLRGGGEGESWRMKKVTWTVEGHDQGWGGNHRGMVSARNLRDAQ